MVQTIQLHSQPSLLSAASASMPIMDSYWPYLLSLPIIIFVYIKTRPRLSSISISNIAGPAVSSKGILGLPIVQRIFVLVSENRFIRQFLGVLSLRCRRIRVSLAGTIWCCVSIQGPFWSMWPSVTRIEHTLLTRYSQDDRLLVADPKVARFKLS